MIFFSSFVPFPWDPGHNLIAYPPFLPDSMYIFITPLFVQGLSASRLLVFSELLPMHMYF